MSNGFDQPSLPNFLLACKRRLPRTPHLSRIMHRVGASAQGSVASHLVHQLCVQTAEDGITVLVMELQQIVDRYAEAIEYVDQNIDLVGVNKRTGVMYQPGFKSLNEEPAVDAIDDGWEILHQGERQIHVMGINYPGLPAYAKIDHLITTDGIEAEPEWGIEVKRLQSVGDNGKGNDYATAKVLSPYLKDRGMLHDALRLREYGFSRRVAVIGYSFDYDRASMLEALHRHKSEEAKSVLNEISKVLKKNGGSLHTRPLIEFADAIMGLRGLTSGPRAQRDFEAWRHPAGGRGVVFGWEIRRPQLEKNYDPRHPW